MDREQAWTENKHGRRTSVQFTKWCPFAWVLTMRGLEKAWTCQNVDSKKHGPQNSWTRKKHGLEKKRTQTNVDSQPSDRQ